jgi:hypothetical protein
MQENCGEHCLYRHGTISRSDKDLIGNFSLISLLSSYQVNNNNCRQSAWCGGILSFLVMQKQVIFLIALPEI